LPLLVLAGPAQALAPARQPAVVVEIPRPALAWIPEGELPTPEAFRLRPDLVRLAPDWSSTCGGGPVGDDSLRSDAGLVADLRAHAAWQELTAPSSAVRGQARWDPRTGLPHRAWLSGLRLRGAPFETAQRAEAAARAFVRERAVLATAGEQPDDADLPLLKARRVGRVWFLVFGQRSRGLEVVDGRVDVRLAVTGEVVAFGSSWFAGVDIPTAPRVDRSVAEAVARAGVGFQTGADRQGASDLAILPVPAGRGVGYRLVHRVHIDTEDPPGAWTTYVDARDGHVWARENDIQLAAATRGTVTGAIFPHSWTDAPVVRAFPTVEVWRNGDTTVAGTDGRYALAGRAPHDTVFTRLRSPFLRVRNQSGENGLAANRPWPPPRPADLEWSDLNSDMPQRNAYYHALAAHARLRELDPELTGMDYPVPCRVNLPGACNAFWDGRSINFFGEGAGCANTAVIADVVIHEYGHGITQHTYAPLRPNPALNEGFSDYFAASTLDDPVIGRDLYGPGTYVRWLENDARIIDPTCFGEPHCLSQGVSGALWDLRQGLLLTMGDRAAAQALADSLWHYAGYGAAYWYNDYLLDLMIVDDDDGTLLDGVPHYKLISRAFSRHGFQVPDVIDGVYIDHEPLADAAPSPASFVVRARIGSTHAPLVAERLHYRVNGGEWLDDALTPLGGNEFEGALPPLPAGGGIEYWLEAQDADGGTAATPPHAFHVGILRTVWADDFEYDHGWTRDETHANAQGRWKRTDPFGTKVGEFRIAPENDASPDGHFCWVTGDTLNIDTNVATADVDDGCTWLLSPPIDLSGLTNARVSYARWYTNEYIYDDTLWVEASGDNGQTWALLEGQPFTQNFWRTMSFDLGSRIPLTDQVRLRVTACDVCGASVTEAGFDDVVFSTRDALAGPRFAAREARGVAGSFGATLALRSSQPLRGAADIAFTVPGEAAGAPVPVRLVVIDMRGRLVATLVHEGMRPGEGHARWGGAGVGPGVYALRLDAGGRQATLKLVRLP